MHRRLRSSSLVILLAALSAGAVHADTETCPFELQAEQITTGPANHFFGYIGHVGNTPWNASGRYMLVLRTTFQDRMPEAGESADIVLLDTKDSYKPEHLETTRAWNPQQGTMLYWNPDAPETQFFFNDRDPNTNAVFCVLYDLETRTRIREYRFDDVPVGNSGVAQGGGSFLAINYGRLARLRPVTGYPGAVDDTIDPHPENDGIFKVDIASGERTLLVSYKQLAEALRPTRPDIDGIPLFINHTLWSREGDRILAFARGGWNDRALPRIDTPFVMDATGTMLKMPMEHIGGHPEWAPGGLLIGEHDNRQVLYDPLESRVVRELASREILRDAGADVALSPDGAWLVNGHRHHGDHTYTLVHLESGAHCVSPRFDIGSYLSGDLRIDPAPCWRRDGRALAFPALAEDGSRQSFVLHLRDARLAATTLDSILQHLPDAAGTENTDIVSAMDDLYVPGLSIALIEDFRIAETFTLGVRVVGTTEKVDEQTRFQAASISKPVAAAALMRLAETGKIDLDEDINAYLHRWKLPPHDFVDAPPVSARLLASHRAGTTVSGYAGYRDDAEIPTLVEVLEGTGGPVAPPVIVDVPPGKGFRYSGGGSTVLQQAMEDITGKAFGELLEASVLAPIGMTHSAYAQPLPEASRVNTAAGHTGRGRPLPGGTYVYPMLFAAGLWTTPSDLAQFAIELQCALRGDADAILSPESARAMTTPIEDGPTGIGFFCRGPYFRHSGSNQGMRCTLVAHKTAGYGIVIMNNGERGEALNDRILRAVIAAKGWDLGR